MSFAAVISASATIGGDDAALRASLVFAGQTLVEYQARQAAEAGAGHISIHVGAITPSLTRSVDRLLADGINVALVRSPAELRQTIPPGTDILLVGDGIVAVQSCYEEMARRSAPSLLVINDHVTQPPFERIDVQHRWAGLARLNSRQLADTLETLDILADWDLQSTLLRHTVQAGPDRVLVSDDALFDGDVAMITTQTAADTAERHFLPAPTISAGGQGWVDQHVLRPIAARVAAVLLRQQVEGGLVRLAAVVIAALALIVAAYGLTWPALTLFLSALAAGMVADGMARVTRRPETANWRDYICPGLALIGLAVLGGHWTVGRISGQFSGLYLAVSVLIVDRAIRRGKTAGMNDWATCSMATALALLLLFRLAGALDLGFALVTLYALATISLILFGKPERTQGVKIAA